MKWDRAFDLKYLRENVGLLVERRMARYFAGLDPEDILMFESLLNQKIYLKIKQE